jgi:hypothetical protein
VPRLDDHDTDGRGRDSGPGDRAEDVVAVDAGRLAGRLADGHQGSCATEYVQSQVALAPDGVRTVG